MIRSVIKVQDWRAPKFVMEMGLSNITNFRREAYGSLYPAESPLRRLGRS
ncbi:hypothetical protein RchiOBHm_Chr1g0320201 [Rosa chinensis]|uniref:Uncharacterized protein n=1 Tax=Rosa chinensis TaxID=74649 RepID=A0A2P6S8L5_ROSCH|nr:hypothetical protein RchiOBHm_Chr1g0320201 [Rosa chinensis]